MFYFRLCGEINIQQIKSRFSISSFPEAYSKRVMSLCKSCKNNDVATQSNKSLTVFPTLSALGQDCRVIKNNATRPNSMRTMTRVFPIPA